MGMYANHADVHYPSGTDDLGDCTACQDTGWVTWPINVTVGQEEQDECPYGCIPLEERDGYYTEYEPEIELEDELLAAWHASKRPVEEVDPFLILSRAARKIGLRPFTDAARRLGRGTVSSDIYLMGLAEDENFLTYPCTVPAHLSGTPVSYEDGVLRLKYEYLGSSMVVRFGALEQEFMRFAYSWDESYSTGELLR